MNGSSSTTRLRGAMMNAIRPSPSHPTTVSPDGPSSVVAPFPTHTFGREHDLQELVDLIDRDDVRLVTLLGPGGVGKTRLAHELTASLAHEYAHGARFVPLDAIRDPARVPGEVAHALGLVESEERSATDLLAEHVADQNMLLVLDNMEQVVDAAHRWLVGILRRAPKLTVLATSRIPLHIDGEYQFLVPPLKTGDDDPGASPSVQLFAERAKMVRHDFAISESNASVIADICRKLDGLPLAIELAAARIKSLSPQALLALLTDRLTLLIGGHRDAPLRLRSMRDAINWSYELLSEEERSLFQRLSVFLGGFTLDAVESVGRWGYPDTSGLQPLDVLHSLVDQSLVLSAPTNSLGRYQMLETIREFGAYQLESQGGEKAYAAHADYICDLARRAERELIGPEQGPWLDRLENEYANIRAAIDWLEHNDRLDDAITVYTSIIGFMDIRGHTMEALQYLERWLQLPEVQERTRSRGLLLYAIGVLLHNTGDFYRGVDVLDESRSLLLQEGDRYYAAIAGAYLGVMLGFVNDIDRMTATLQDNIDLARTAGHHRALSLSLNMMANCGWGSPDKELPLAFANRSFVVAHEHGDWWMVAFALMGPMIEAFRQGQYDEAERHIRESMRLRTMIGSKRDLPADWMFLGWATYQQGDANLAEECLETAQSIADETGHSWYRALVSVEAAILATERGKLKKARTLLLTHLNSFHTNHRLDLLADCLVVHAKIASLCGDAAHTARFLGSAEALTRDYGDIDHFQEPSFRMLTDSWRKQLASGQSFAEWAYRKDYEEGSSWTIEDALAAALTYVLPDLDQNQKPEETKSAPAGLSPRELDVLSLMAKGLSNQHIADALFVSHRTVTTHVTHIMTKLDAASRTAAVAWAIRNGIA